VLHTPIFIGQERLLLVDHNS